MTRQDPQMRSTMQPTIAPVNSAPLGAPEPAPGQGSVETPNGKTDAPGSGFAPPAPAPAPASPVPQKFG